MSTTVKLPALIAAFVQAKNEHDSAALAACFAEDAVVHDEGEEHRGTAAIKHWNEASNQKYQDTLKATALVERGGATILTALVAGNFEGSPVPLDFYFTIDGGKITGLHIELTGE